MFDRVKELLVKLPSKQPALSMEIPQIKARTGAEVHLALHVALYREHARELESLDQLKTRSVAAVGLEVLDRLLEESAPVPVAESVTAEIAAIEDRLQLLEQAGVGARQGQIAALDVEKAAEAAILREQAELLAGKQAKQHTLEVEAKAAAEAVFGCELAPKQPPPMQFTRWADGTSPGLQVGIRQVPLSVILAGQVQDLLIKAKNVEERPIHLNGALVNCDTTDVAEIVAQVSADAKRPCPLLIPMARHLNTLVEAEKKRRAGVRVDSDLFIPVDHLIRFHLFWTNDGNLDLKYSRIEGDLLEWTRGEIERIARIDQQEAEVIEQRRQHTAAIGSQKPGAGYEGRAWL
ncbi:MAG: hypothetical protein ACR2NN_29090 [Bryobacteraceae bacterium]